MNDDLVCLFSGVNNIMNIHVASAVNSTSVYLEGPLPALQAHGGLIRGRLPISDDSTCAQPHIAGVLHLARSDDVFFGELNLNEKKSI